MKIRFRTNLVSGIVFGLFSLVVWLLIPTQIMSKGSYTIVNAQFVPKLVTVLIFAFSIILIIQSLVFKKDNYAELHFKKEFRLILFFLFLLTYLILMNVIGFLIASLVFCTATLFYLRSRNWKHYVSTYIIVFILFLIFTKVLSVPLP
jgi:amino acid transporter